MDDLQMVRGAVEGGYNLAIGEPVLLQQHLALPAATAKGPFRYPRLGGEPELLGELERLYPDKHIVVTCGAKQALEAAFHALSVSDDGGYWVTHAPPHWPSYRTLACKQGMAFHHGGFGDDTDGRILCVTSPNNPDGKETTAACDVWDSVYAHWVYGWSGAEPSRYRIRVGSASKLLGLPGLRVGWLVTADEGLAASASNFVEKATSGVSVLDQEYVAEALARMPYMTSALEEAREAMLDNALAFERAVTPYCDHMEGVPASGKGMFAWFRVSEPWQARFADAIKKASVAMVTGDACGMREPGWYRANMMVAREDMEGALTKLKEHL